VFLSGLTYINSEGVKSFEQIFDDVGNLVEFWGFIKKNIDQFHKTYIFAHNGGKFDLQLLLRDVLTTEKTIDISEKKFCELNGRLLSMRVNISSPGDKEGKMNKWIEFRDSYALFTNSLKVVTRDFCKVTLKDTINHEKIN